MGGFGGQIGGFAMHGIASVAPVAALLAFAVVYFGVMNDAGLFDPAIRAIVRRVGGDPVRIALGTAGIAAIAHLDGAGASTFMVTVPAMLPIYQRLGMSPLSLTAIVALAAGTMNMLPWGGPTSRAAAALHIASADLFVPTIPAMIAGMATVFGLSALIGRRERLRIAGAGEPEGLHSEAARNTVDTHNTVDPPARRLWYFNAGLTAVTLGALFVEALPLAFVFLASTAVALLVNYPDARQQQERLGAHGGAAMLMVTTVLAAGVFTGILTKSGMLTSLSADLVHALPAAVLGHLPVAMGIASMPLSLVFDPDSFYYGVLPVAAQAAQGAGGDAVEVGRAALLGQMTTGFPVSPLTPATFLLVGLAGVDLADHQRKTIPYAFAVTLVMTAVAAATGAIRL
jgi:CitMHS family citrate-Mg2+:H+ or citrate-Ca2+:H+ symporter